MKAVFLSAGIACVCAVALAAGPGKKPSAEKETELAILRRQLETCRDSLQYEIAQRYTIKQTHVQQREADREEADQLRESQEQAIGELSKIKEEAFAAEQNLEEEIRLAAGEAGQWKAVASTAEDLLQKEAAFLAETFPVDKEQRRARLEAVRRELAASGNSAAVMQSWGAYKRGAIVSAATVRIEQATVFPAEGGLAAMTLARFGNVFAYGLDSAGGCFLISQTGKLGEQRYIIEAVSSPELTAFIQTEFPVWLGRGRPTNPVLIDVLQNEQSRLLVSGKRSTAWQGFIAQIKAGGAVMVPLLALPFWALWLTILKIVQIYGRQRRFGRQYRAVMKFLDTGDGPGALAYLKGQKGMMARALETCIGRTGGQRSVAEEEIREIIFHEVPIVNRGLNTLAVIAGAAPLLGLLGTISGMISLFAAVTHYGSGDPKFLAGGISEALITAKTGLAIAIPVLFIHDFLRNGKEHLLSNIEHYATQALNRLWPREP